MVKIWEKIEPDFEAQEMMNKIMNELPSARTKKGQVRPRKKIFSFASEVFEKRGAGGRIFFYFQDFFY